MSLYSYHHDAAGQLVIEPRKEFYSVKQIALILGVSTPTAWRFVSRKKLGAHRIGGRWRVPYKALQYFLRKSWSE